MSEFLQTWRQRGACPGQRAVVLLSGGLDSATCLALARESGMSCFALSFSYGQFHDVELKRAKTQAKRQGATEHRIVKLDLGALGGSALTDPSIELPNVDSEADRGAGVPVTYVPARNTLFLSYALAWAEVLGARVILIGVNALDYSGYPDCRPEFIEAFNAMAAVGTREGVEGKPVHVVAPLQYGSKAQIVREAVRLGVDLSATVSCYAATPEGASCGHCDACYLRRKGFEEAGLADPARQ